MQREFFSIEHVVKCDCSQKWMKKWFDETLNENFIVVKNSLHQPSPWIQDSNGNQSMKSLKINSRYRIKIGSTFELSFAIADFFE